MYTYILTHRLFHIHMYYYTHTYSHRYAHITHTLAFIDTSHTFPCIHSYTYTYTHTHSHIPPWVFSILLCSYQKISLTLCGKDMISAYSPCQRTHFLSLQWWVLLDVRHAMSNACKMSLMRKVHHYKHTGGLNASCENPAKTDLRSTEWNVRKELPRNWRMERSSVNNKDICRSSQTEECIF